MDTHQMPMIRHFNCQYLYQRDKITNIHQREDYNMS